MPHAATWTSATSNNKNTFLNLTEEKPSSSDPRDAFRRRQSQQSDLAKLAMQTSTQVQQELVRRLSDGSGADDQAVDQLRDHLDRTLSNGGDGHQDDGRQMKPPPQMVQPRSMAAVMRGNDVEATCATALNDTPAPSAPSSPNLLGNRQGIIEAAGISLGVPMRVPGSGSSTPRIRPTTLDIPGLTKSKVSPDGRIAKRDVGAKLVIVMVGLPARGKSYITKKLARYLNWLQHDTKIFNVGERRRVAAIGSHSPEQTRSRNGEGVAHGLPAPPALVEHFHLDSESLVKHDAVAHIILNGETELEPPSASESNGDSKEDGSDGAAHRNGHEEEERDLRQPDMGEPRSPYLSRRHLRHSDVKIEQNADFFEPDNHQASQIREHLARDTLDELLDYILDGNGSVGILDATNSTLDRRKMVMDRIRERAGPDLNVLFLESRCVDPDLLEANMKLKLSGPDYKDTDPTIALADFKKRVQAYEKAYVPLGDYEERHNMPYIQMIDVGRKVISHQIKGFLMAQANYYLLNFNLAPRQIWITRHGLSEDNVSGRIGGDSDLAAEGHQYAKSLVRFMDQMRNEWDVKRLQTLTNSHFPPLPGDVTPPNPHYQSQSPATGSDNGSVTSGSTDGQDFRTGAFCVWTSMLKRSIETAQYFNDEDYDVKQMRMLDELNAGTMEGLTYSSISTSYPEEYARRRADKMHYRYPGPGGEGYLDIINRLRPVIVELERMTDNVLLIGHRSVARVLLAYFRGLKREDVADVEVPIGMLYCLEPKPYGVDFRAYKWHSATEWFYEQPNFQLRTNLDEMM